MSTEETTDRNVRLDVDGPMELKLPEGHDLHVMVTDKSVGAGLVGSFNTKGWPDSKIQEFLDSMVAAAHKARVAAWTM